MRKKRGIIYHNVHLVGIGLTLIILLFLLLFILPTIIGEDIIDEKYPEIKFTYPTPPNATKKELNYTEIKINTTEKNLETFIWNWNGTDYPLHYDSLVLFMNLDNNANLGESNAYVKDLSLYENHGTIYGATYTQARHGYGLEFNNKEDYLGISDDSSLDLDIFSIEFWFKPHENYKENSGYISFVYHDNYKIYMQDGKIVFDYNGNKINSSTNSWEKDRWYHILATFDGVQALYVNGLKEKSIIVFAPFNVKNMAGENVAFFLNSGDIVLKGNCKAQSCSYPKDDAFVVQNQQSETVAYIDNNGNLCIEDTNCNDNDIKCDDGDTFIVKNTHDEIVSYIDSNGNLCLVGDLIENGIS